MKLSDIHEALNVIGLATPREIFDYIGKTKVIDYKNNYSTVENILIKNNISFYSFNEHFAKRRYTLSHKSDNQHPIPEILVYTPIDEAEECAKSAIKTREPIIIKNNKVNLQYWPDVDRKVVFCVNSNRYIDGVIDLRRPIGKRIRFPTVIFSTFNRPIGKSEWLRACELYFGLNNTKFLRIRGTDR